jgi:hypothetical protein
MKGWSKKPGTTSISVLKCPISFISTSSSHYLIKNALLQNACSWSSTCAGIKEWWSNALLFFVFLVGKVLIFALYIL